MQYFVISKIFREYKRMKNLDCKNKKIDTKYLTNIKKNQFLKVNNSLLELGKYVMELKDRQLKDREEKIQKGDRKTILLAEYCV